MYTRPTENLDISKLMKPSLFSTEIHIYSKTDPDICTLWSVGSRVKTLNLLKTFESHKNTKSTIGKLCSMRLDDQGAIKLAEKYLPGVEGIRSKYNAESPRDGVGITVVPIWIFLRKAPMLVRGAKATAIFGGTVSASVNEKYAGRDACNT